MLLTIILLKVTIYFSVSSSMRLERNPGSPPIDKYNNLRWPSPPTKINDFVYPPNFDGSSDSYASGQMSSHTPYCKRIQKKIEVDEQIFPFSACLFENDDDADDDDDHHSQTYKGGNHYFKHGYDSKSYNEGAQTLLHKNKHESSIANDILGATYEGTKSVSSYSIPRQDFQSPRVPNYWEIDPSYWQNHPNGHFSRDEFNARSFKNPIQQQSPPSEVSNEESSLKDKITPDLLKSSKTPIKNINTQTDREKILEILKTSKNRKNSTQNFFIPIENASSSNFNAQSLNEISNTNDENNDSTSSVLSNQQDLQFKSSAESNKFLPQGFDNISPNTKYYQYMAGLQDVPSNYQYNQFIPSKYSGLQPNSFSINAFNYQNNNSKSKQSGN